MRRVILASALLLAGLAGGTQSARAQAILFLDDFALGGFFDVLLMDGAAAGTLTPFGLTTHGDAAVDGFISYSGGVLGGVFSINVSTGVSKPIIGPSRIDLTSVDVSSGGGGTLRVGFADDGFTFIPGNSEVRNEIGGVTDGTVDTMYGANPANLMFAGPSGVQGPFGPGAFAGTASFNVAGLGTPFSISHWATITHMSGGDITSFDMLTSVVPEPTSLLLVGAGLLGGGAFLRRKRPRA